MSCNIGTNRNVFLKVKNRIANYSVIIEYENKKLLFTILEYQNLPDIDNLDIDQQISNFNWTLHNGRRKICINYRSDQDLISLSVYKLKKDQWIIHQEIGLKLKEYNTLLNKRQSLLCYVGLFTKKCIFLEEETNR